MVKDNNQASAGIVLCGGRSSRMGQPKHQLRLGSQTVLERIIETVGAVTGQVFVVGSPSQDLPSLPDGTRWIRDEEAHYGPLSGLRSGLRAVPGETAAVYLTGCDTPLLKPAVVTRIMSALTEDVDVAVVRQQGFLHPLAAVYRVSLLPQVERFLDQGELRPRRLIEASRFRVIDAESLRDIDADLESLRNMNTQEEYDSIREIVKHRENR
ncbi:MAG: molybdenum cofactor guanylyltransferase [Planctomycetaceae bacterium]|nr:molybdenum cofactor guanylyltransferase [Planctomycetaceae bacterium]